jgi:CubicO group peptidase (beta-lactamase class C family)
MIGCGRRQSNNFRFPGVTGDLLRRQKSILVCCLLLGAVAAASGYSGLSGDSVSAATAAGEAIRSFVGEEVVLDRYIFPPGLFPGVRWKDPEAVRKTVGPVPLTVEFYDRSFTRVDRAAGPGRYGAVVRGTAPGGFPIVRYITLYCCNVRFDDYGPDVPLALQSLPEFGIPPGRWEMYRKNLRSFSFGSLLLSPEHDPDEAILLAGLADVPPRASPRLTPRLIDRRWWVTFKRRTDGVPHPGVDLSLRSSRDPGPVLDEKRGLSLRWFTPGDRKILLDICTAWSESSRVPMTAVIARKGRVIFHEAFGKMRNGKLMTHGTPTWMASITKSLMGVLVMEFVDRGYVELDVPIDRYLPELASSSPCPLTLRLLLTHTSGLSWAGEWASDWNPSMENQVAQALPVLTPGREFKYHRAGYALAAKVLERISGETVPQLFEKMLLSPLGMTRSTVDNSYGGLYAPALDLARFGQMLLSRGRYGSYQFVSEHAWRTMLPAPLRTIDPLPQKAWGIGVAPFARDGLSDSTFGHSAASGAIFRVDPVRELVIVVGRDAVGPDENQDRRFASQFIRALTAALDRRTTHE